MSILTFIVLQASLTLAPWIKLIATNPTPVAAPKEVMTLVKGYIEKGEPQSAPNLLGGTVRLDTIGNAYLCLHPTASSTYQGILLAPTQGDTLLLSLYTLRTPSPHTVVQWYDVEAHPTSGASHFTPPTVDLFVSDAEAQRLIVPTVVSYHWDPTTHRLTATLQVRDYLTDEVYDRVKPHLRDSIQYSWDGARFRLIDPSTPTK